MFERCRCGKQAYQHNAARSRAAASISQNIISFVTLNNAATRIVMNERARVIAWHHLNE